LLPASGEFSFATHHTPKPPHIMPKEMKKRGRRMEGTKRKHEEAEEYHTLPQDTKRQKSVEPGQNGIENGQDYVSLAQGDGDDDPMEDVMQSAYPVLDTPFFGMLDEEEQEYFKHADEMLEMNSFDDAEQRQLFLANVWREAEGKELKIANSQSCSRLMERLIQLSTPAQLKGLFRRFYGKYVQITSKHVLGMLLLTLCQLRPLDDPPICLTLLRSSFHTCCTSRH
jgi:hypothetical protein